MALPEQVHRVIRPIVAVLVAFCALLVVLLLPLGCVNRVIPPAVVHDPVEVYLVDHGRTPSLILPRADGGMARYVYGDWQWYAHGRTNLFTGIGAVLLPTQGALGRELLHGPPSPDAILDQVVVVVEQIYPLMVERSLAVALEAELDSIFVQNADTALENPDYALIFVHHPDRYTYFWNSNHQVAHWLQEIGCEVRGPAFNSRWSVQQQPTPTRSMSTGP